MRVKFERGEEPAILMIALACLVALLTVLLVLPPVSGSRLWVALRELCFGTTPALVSSGSLPPPRTRITLVSDAERGAVVAAQVCSSCHGSGANHAAFAPHLDGLSEGYLARQLDDYASGRRRWPVMEAIASSLEPSDRLAVAAHYARLVPNRPAAAPAPAWVRTLATNGDASRGLPACTACHGQRGQGIKRQAPRIAGRPSADIAHALRMFREGARANDTGRPMRNVASRLTDAEIAALGSYWTGVGASGLPHLKR